MLRSILTVEHSNGQEGSYIHATPPRWEDEPNLVLERDEKARDSGKRSRRLWTAGIDDGDTC